MKEIKSLTAIRGLFAIYVAIYHIFPRSNSFIANGYLSVDLFFILSGFIMSYVYNKKFSINVRLNDYVNFLKGRFARIYPLYFFMIISISSLYFINGIALPSFREYSSLFLFFQSFYVVQNNLIPHAWSIAVEILAYLAFPFATNKLTGQKNNAAIIPAIYLSFAGLSLVSMHGYWGPMDVGTGVFAIIRCLCEYILGMTGYTLLIKYQHKLTPVRIETMLVIACIVAIASLSVRNFDLIAVSAFTFIIPLLSQSNGVISSVLSSKPMVYLGNISFSIYLIHYPLCRKLIFIPSWIHNKIGLFDVNTTTLMLTIFLSIFTYHLIEVPFRNFIKNFK